MIAHVSGSGSVATVEALEKELQGLGCEKVGPCTKRTCIWKSPSGKHFSAPNPDTMYLVPTDSLYKIKTMIVLLAQIKRPR